MNPKENGPDEDNSNSGYKKCASDEDCLEYWKDLEAQTPGAIPCVNKWKSWNCYKVDLGELSTVKSRNNKYRPTNKFHPL